VPRFGKLLPDLFEADTESDVHSSAPSTPPEPWPGAVAPTGGDAQGISVSPAACEWFEAGASAAPESVAAPAPEIVPPRVEASRRRRQKVVLTAVCALGAAVFVLAGLRFAHRAVMGNESSGQTVAAAPVAAPPPPVPQAAMTAVAAPAPRANAPVSQAANATPAKATTPASKGVARPVRPRNAYSPQSL
jgi:hypothetical protein